MATTSLLKVFRYQDYKLVSHSNPLTFTGATITISDGLYQDNDWINAVTTIFPAGDGFCSYFNIDWMTDTQAMEMFIALSDNGNYRVVPTILTTDEFDMVTYLRDAFDMLNNMTGMLPYVDGITFTGGTMRVTPSYTGTKSLKTLFGKLGLLFPAKLSNAESKQSETVAKTEYVGTYYSGIYQYGCKRTIYSTSRVETDFKPTQCGFNFKNMNLIANANDIGLSSAICDWEVPIYDYYIDYNQGTVFGDTRKNMCSFKVVPSPNYPISFVLTNIASRDLYVTVQNTGASYGITSVSGFTLKKNGTYTLKFTPQTKLASMATTQSIILNFSVV